MNKHVNRSQKTGVAIFKTTPYGERLHNGSIRTYFCNEVRLISSVYRVVEVTKRGDHSAEIVLCEYMEPTEYPSLMQAIDVAVNNRKEFLETQAEEMSAAAEIVKAEERMYMLGASPENADQWAFVQAASGCAEEGLLGM